MDLKIITNPNGKIKSRDEELDDLTREATEQSLHNDRQAKSLALQHYEQNLQPTPVQKMSALLRKLLGGEGCVDCLTEGNEKHELPSAREQKLKKLCEEGEESACVE